MPPSKRRELTEAERSEILTWHKAGKSIRQIKALVNRSESTIHGVIRRAKERPENPTATAKRSGRPAKLTVTAKRKLVRYATQNPRDTLAMLTTPSKSGSRLAKGTVRTVLKASGVHRRKARKKPYMGKAHRQERVRWCNEFKHFTKRDWRNVLFSDEATFEVGKDYRTIWVSRRSEDEWNVGNLKPSFKSGRTTVGVWGVIVGGKMGPLYVMKEGRMNMIRYTNEVLEPLFFPFYKKIKKARKRQRILSMEDNAKWHTGRIPTQWREKNGFPRIWWPA